MGEMRNAYKFRSENLKGREYFEVFGVDERIILKKKFVSR
jgi:hypothetical protein